MKTILYLLLASVSFYLLDGVIGFLLSEINGNHFEFFTFNRFRSSIVSAVIILIYMFFIKVKGK